jgi:uncharacterized membrane protein (DUF485 family)
VIVFVVSLQAAYVTIKVMTDVSLGLLLGETVLLMVPVIVIEYVPASPLVELETVSSLVEVSN